jgi:hypothetical protein
MIALHCSCTGERERERERDYYYHASAIMQRTLTAGSNRSWDCLYCGTFGSSDTNSLVCKKCWKFQKITFSNEPKFVKEIRESSFQNIEKNNNFDLESSKLINYSMDMVLNLPMHCNIGHPCV